MKLTPAQLDRACGAVLGTAVGDALGAPYEFGLATVGPDGPRMIGGGLGGFAPGEWTDDTAMAWCILDVAATGADLRTEEALTQIARSFRAWYDSGPPDIGNQTRTILGAVGADPTGATMTATSYDLHARTGHTAGNGSLMRTAPVALAYLDDPVALVEAARKVGALTHYDPHAQEACALWSLAIRHAVLHAELDVRAGLAYLDAEAAAYWTERLDEAESSEPGRFRPNGWAVAALQAAWSAITHTPGPDRRPCRAATSSTASPPRSGSATTPTPSRRSPARCSARGGGRRPYPAEWRRLSHGYPGIRGERLVELAHLTANKGPGVYGWPLVDHIDYSMYGSAQDLGAAPVRRRRGARRRHPRSTICPTKSRPSSASAWSAGPGPRRPRARRLPAHRPRRPSRQPQPRLHPRRRRPHGRDAARRGPRRAPALRRRPVPHAGRRHRLRHAARCRRDRGV